LFKVVTADPTYAGIESTPLFCNQLKNEFWGKFEPKPSLSGQVKVKTVGFCSNAPAGPNQKNALTYEQMFIKCIYESYSTPEISP